MILYSVILFISAALLLWAQPMFGKMILPLLGGAPAVWNTCLVFFQSALLLGYWYAHILGRAPLKVQHWGHSALVLAGFAFLPITTVGKGAPPVDGSPVWWLLGALTVSIGAPFFILSATAPLLQRWFSFTSFSRARDPYFLYAAGNLGSILGLIAYPVAVEPYLTLAGQSRAWTAGYALLFALIVIAGFSVRGREKRDDETHAPESASTSLRERGMRLILAAAPASLLQSVTTYMTTDIAPIPLLWILPLAVYFLTFVIVFSRKPLIPHEIAVRTLPFFIVTLIFAAFWQHHRVIQHMFPLALGTLFFAGLACHGRLAAMRPAPEKLTEYYLDMALGGALGGAFSALLAPMIFDRLWEYPLVLVLMAALTARAEAPLTPRDLLVPIITTAAALFLMVADKLWSFYVTLWGQGLIALILGGVILTLRQKKRAFALGVAAYVAAGLLVSHIHLHTIYLERSFYGAFGVELDREKALVTLFHGNTPHGSQSLDRRFRKEPTCYYFRGGPLGEVFSLLKTRGATTIGVIGLGAGAMAGYAGPDDSWVFYELNPGIARIARDPHYFSFLSDSPAKQQVVLGDGRISIQKAPDGVFDAVILDAFSSDAVPIHLLTREALTLYLQKTKDQGVVALHLSNNYINLSDAPAATLASLGHTLYVKHFALSTEDSPLGCSSTWACVSRDPAFGAALEAKGWSKTPGDPRAAWTDDYSNLFKYLRLWVRLW